jgi:hypothetical protein
MKKQEVNVANHVYRRCLCFSGVYKFYASYNMVAPKNDKRKPSTTHSVNNTWIQKTLNPKYHELLKL